MWHELLGISLGSTDKKSIPQLIVFLDPTDDLLEMIVEPDDGVIICPKLPHFRLAFDVEFSLRLIGVA